MERRDFIKKMSLAAAGAAHGASCRVIGLASVAGSPLLEGSDIAVHLETGAEIVADTYRLAYVADPDGHLWEIAHNPYSPNDESGRMQLAD